MFPNKGVPQKLSQLAYLPAFVSSTTAKLLLPRTQIAESAQSAPEPNAQTLPLCGMNFNATPLLHHRCPVGLGPSLNKWP